MHGGNSTKIMEDMFYNNQSHMGLPDHMIKHPTTGKKIYGSKKKTIQQRNQEMINESYQEYQKIQRQKLLNHRLSLNRDIAIGSYHNAFVEIIKMVNGSDTDLTRATYLVENAYKNSGTFDEFNTELEQIADHCMKLVKEKGYDQNDNMAKNMVLFELFSDSLSYDFEDYLGNKDWSKMFVSKLLKQRTGQCHSMPLLYLMIMEKMQGQAHLAFSPNHSYIKIQDKTGRWHNLELTSKVITSDASIISSGFITSEAATNKLYMQPLTMKELLAQSLNDLAMGYQIKLGNSPFVLQCINKALSLNPHNVTSLQMKVNYYIAELQYMVDKLGYTNERQVVDNPRTLAALKRKLISEKALKDSGYKKMPKDKYESWLKTYEGEKKKQESEMLEKGIKLKIDNQ